MNDKTMGYSTLSALCMELHLIIKAGIPLTDGISLLLDDANEKSDTSFRRILSNLHDNCENGSNIGEAFAKVDAFPSYMLQMIRIGEETGNLDIIFRSLATYYDRQLAISQSLRSMVLFPCVLFATMLIIIVVLITYVLPIFQSVFTQLGASVSTTTAWLLNLGKFLMRSQNVFLIILITVAIAGVVFYLNKNLRQRLSGFISSLFSRTKISNKIASARFTSAMAMAITSGIDIVSSLQMAENIVKSSSICKKSENCRKIIADGEMFYSAVSQSKLFEPVYCRMLSVGVKTGSTDIVMEDIAKKSEEQANLSIESTIAKVEPGLVLVMSLLVGFILLSVMIPLMGIMSSIG